MYKPLHDNFPGLFATPTTVRQAQQAVIRYANTYVKDVPNADLERSRIIADERELRNRQLVRSAVLWAVLGIPLLVSLVGGVLLFFATSLMGRTT